ncbi:MAG: hypothetical protein H0V43_14365 [Gemmatimonadales bacterium]|nr:hypothetical protein [Gemmatimonadales bacterium]
MSPSLRSLVVLFHLVAGPWGGLSAQWPPEIAPGARVRARVPEVQYQREGTRGHFLRGRVTALSPDTLYLAIADSLGPLAVPRRLIERLDYSRGVPSLVSSALREGLVSAAGSALLLVLLTDRPREVRR